MGFLNDSENSLTLGKPNKKFHFSRFLLNRWKVNLNAFPAYLNDQILVGEEDRLAEEGESLAEGFPKHDLDSCLQAYLCF